MSGYVFICESLQASVLSKEFGVVAHWKLLSAYKMHTQSRHWGGGVPHNALALGQGCASGTAGAGVGSVVGELVGKPVGDTLGAFVGEAVAVK